MKFLYGLLCVLLSQDAFAECKPKKTCPSWGTTGWAITAFSGPLTTQTSSKIFSDAKFDSSAIIGLALSKKLGSIWCNQLDFELETLGVQHVGKQKHFEIDPIALIVRWKNFPWNRSLPTTFAIGDGLSIATEKPKLEVKERGDRKSAQTLNYVMAELTLSLPDYPNWALVARYHHRSGMFGMFHGVHDASTAFAAGIKYWF